MITEQDRKNAQAILGLFSQFFTSPQSSGLVESCAAVFAASREQAASASEHGPFLTSYAWLQHPDFAGVKVIDPDGWNRAYFEDSWNERISREEFEKRLARSTCSFPPGYFLRFQAGGPIGRSISPTKDVVDLRSVEDMPTKNMVMEQMVRNMLKMHPNWAHCAVEHLRQIFCVRIANFSESARKDAEAYIKELVAQQIVRSKIPVK